MIDPRIDIAEKIIKRSDYLAFFYNAIPATKLPKILENIKYDQK